MMKQAALSSVGHRTAHKKKHRRVREGRLGLAFAELSYVFERGRKKAAEAALRRAPLRGVAPLPGVTQQRTVINCPRLRRRGQHTTSAFRSRRLAHGAAWDRMPVRYFRISKSNGHGEREQYDRKVFSIVSSSLYPLTDALVINATE